MLEGTCNHFVKKYSIFTEIQRPTLGPYKYLKKCLQLLLKQTALLPTVMVTITNAK